MERDGSLNGTTRLSLTCRMCAHEERVLIPIFEGEGIKKKIADKISAYLPIQVSQEDFLPLQICSNCVNALLKWDAVVMACMAADKKLRKAYWQQQGQHALEGLSTLGQHVQNPVTSDAINADEDQLSLNEGSGERSPVIKNLDDSFPDAGNLSDFEGSIAEPEEIKDTNIKPAVEQGNVMTGFSCHVCQKTYTRKFDMKKHLKKQHGIESEVKKGNKPPSRTGPFYCPICGKPFTRNGDVDRHKRSVHTEEELAADVEDPPYLGPAELAAATRQSSEGLVYYHCDKCEKDYYDQRLFDRHMWKHAGDKSSVCHLCGKKLGSAEVLARHVRFVHKGIKNYKCDICGRGFSQKFFMTEHRRVHSDEKPYVCDICGRTFKQKASLYVHKTFHEGQHPCNVCGKIFRRRKVLNLHSAIHRQV